MPRVVLVVPCYNEEQRFPSQQMAEVFADERIHLLLVDDGSRDGTHGVLERFAAEHAERATVLRLEQNQGKAEAVRRGMLHALERGSDVVGYADADLATPPDELVRLVSRCLEDTALEVVIAARLAILGSSIDRNMFRHYLGRVFATGASLVLRVPVYDTQCGAKVFRACPALDFALGEPFHSRWSFDVELLGRLFEHREAHGRERIDGVIELPLRVWVDVAGSKLNPLSMFKAGLDLLRIRSALADVRRKLAAR